MLIRIFWRIFFRARFVVRHRSLVVGRRPTRFQLRVAFLCDLSSFFPRTLRL